MLHQKFNIQIIFELSSNPTHGEMHSIQHNVIKFVSGLQQIGGFPRALRFPPPIKLTATI
jgi:hypothetical protein